MCIHAIRSLWQPKELTNSNQKVWGLKAPPPMSSDTIQCGAQGIVAYPLQIHDSSVKLGAVLNIIISQLRSTCSCRLSAKYVASSNLVCGDRTTDRVILEGTLIGALESSSADLHTQLQNWVDTGPTTEVIGSQLQVVPCSTYPGHEASCESTPATSTATTATPATIPRVADAEESSSGLGGVTLYAAVGGGVALLLIVVLVIVVLTLAIRKRRNGKFTPTRYSGRSLSWRGLSDERKRDEGRRERGERGETTIENAVNVPDPGHMTVISTTDTEEMILGVDLEKTGRSLYM